MRIAQVSPLYESVPPRFYGGTERVIHYLTEALVEMGHEVTLFASGDSVTSAKLVSPCPAALRLGRCVDQMAHHILLMEQVAQRADEFDIVHFHIDYLHFPLTRHFGLTAVTTLHGRLDMPDLVNLYREFDEVPLISISDAQRKPLHWVNWQGTVHHGLPEGLLPYSPGGGDYLAFLGRISPEKRVDRAVEIARLAGMKLKVAAKIDPNDREYYSGVKHLLHRDGVEFVGEIGEDEKAEFLGGAHAMLFPIDWPEPFGLVIIEAMACGTPIVAFEGGSVRELVDEGVTGYVCGSVEEAAAAVRRAGMLDRKNIRDTFERRFTSGRMADNYLDAYRRVISAAGGRPEFISEAAA